MPTNRFQFSDDFVLNANKVGINTATPQEKLDVVGIVKGDNLKVTGVSSFTSYEGFLNSNHNITENITLTSGTSGSLSGEIIVGTGITLSGISSTTSGQGHIDSLKVYNTLTIPVGGTLERPSKSKPGQLYYNKDFATIEFYDGDRWRQVDTTTQSGRGVFGGGQTPTALSIIDFINISSTGNALNFGTLSVARAQLAACSSSTRALFGGGNVSALAANTIDYITIASEGNAIDFGGDLFVSRRMIAACSSSTRGVFGGGITVPANVVTNVIDYVQISTLGTALDFGDLTIARRTRTGAVSSPTRGVFLGGTAPGGFFNVIEFVTIASTGDAVDFGDSLFSGAYRTGCSNAVRGLFGGGYAPPVPINAIEYLTIATTGNATYFGDLTATYNHPSACSSSTRGVFGGDVVPLLVNTIDFITINTAGNAQDFGDLTQARGIMGACSDSHGGLGGF